MTITINLVRLRHVSKQNEKDFYDRRIKLVPLTHTKNFINSKIQLQNFYRRICAPSQLGEEWIVSHFKDLLDCILLRVSACSMKFATS